MGGLILHRQAQDTMILFQLTHDFKKSLSHQRGGGLNLVQLVAIAVADQFSNHVSDPVVQGRLHQQIGAQFAHHNDLICLCSLTVLNILALNQFDTDVDLWVETLDGQGVEDCPGIPDACVEMIIREHDHCLSLSQVSFLKDFRLDLTANEPEIRIIQGLFVQLGNDDYGYFLALLVSTQFRHDFVAPEVPPADDEMSLHCHCFHTPVLHELVFDKNAGDGSR